MAVDISTADQAKLDQARTELDAALSAIRGNGDLTELAKQKQIAAAYIKAKDIVKAVEARSSEDSTARLLELQRKLFGVAGLPGSDTATAIVAYRDAQDRADRLEREGEALRLLERAETSGDEYLARAVADAAYRQLWPSVLDAYCAQRPGNEADMIELRTLQRIGGLDLGTTTGFLQGMEFHVPVPPELSSASGNPFGDYRIAEIASGSTPARW